MPMPATAASRGEAKTTLSPSSTISPPSGAMSPAIMFIKVDLPAPFSPRMPTISPGQTSRSTASLATVAPKTFVTPLTARSGRPAANSAAGRFSLALTDGREITYFAGADIVHDLLDLRLVLGGDFAVEFAIGRETDAVLVEAQQVVLGLERAVDDLADGHLEVDVEIDEGCRDDGVRRERCRIEGGGDHQHLLLLGGFERADHAFIAGGGDDIGALLDEADGDLLALGDIGEGPDIGRQHLGLGIDPLGAALEAFVVFLDHRNGNAADVTDDSRLAHRSRDGAGDISGIAPAIVERGKIGRFGDLDGVDDEPGLGELLVDLHRGLAELEAVADHHVVALSRIGKERFLRFGEARILAHRDLDLRKLLLRRLDALIRRRAECAVGDGARSE